MTTNNKLERSFGPVGTSAGVSLFVAGLISTYFSLTGLILVLLGAFVGFTTISTLIDYNKRRLKFSNNLFGFIRIGKWTCINEDMKIGIKKSNKIWRAYRRSNRTLDISKNDFILTLFDENGAKQTCYFLW